MSELRFGPLPGTVLEAREIGRILGLPGKRVLIAEAANEAAVKAVSGPRILHLATHGFFLADQPQVLPAWPARRMSKSPGQEHPLLRSGLALNGFNNRRSVQGSDDGVLTALEAANLDLWGTEVVVLSACETGLGDVRAGQGVFGLRRALVLAGSRSQLMTLWKVADEPTRDFMISWYRQILTGVPRAEALRAVQLAFFRGEPIPMSEKRGVRLARQEKQQQVSSNQKHPYYWAAFILSGESGPVSPETMTLAQ